MISVESRTETKSTTHVYDQCRVRENKVVVDCRSEDGGTANKSTTPFNVDNETTFNPDKGSSHPLQPVEAYALLPSIFSHANQAKSSSTFPR